MKITYKKKIIRNLGNYENISIEIEAEDTVDYEQNQSYETVYDKLRVCVGKSISDESKKIDEYLKIRGK